MGSGLYEWSLVIQYQVLIQDRRNIGLVCEHLIKEMVGGVGSGMVDIKGILEDDSVSSG